MKKVYLMSALVSLSLCISCAKKDEEAARTAPAGDTSATANCNTGLNAGVCQLEVADHSRWMNETRVQRPNERDYVLQSHYEFTLRDGKPIWQRTLVIKGDGEDKTMAQSGEVQKVEGNKITLLMKNTSCSDEASELWRNPQQLTLYYSRNGSALKIADHPIVNNAKAANSADSVAQSASEVIAKSLKAAKSIFVGSRAFLESSYGTYAIQGQAKTNFNNFGCFNNDGFKAEQK